MDKNLVVLVLFLSFILYICFQHENSRFEKEHFVVRNIYQYIKDN